jgi:hypothetical protein
MGFRIYPNEDDPDGVCFAVVTDVQGTRERLLVLVPEGDGYAVAASIPYEREGAIPMTVEWRSDGDDAERGHYQGRAVASLRRTAADGAAAWRVLNLTVLGKAEVFPSREAAVAYVEAQAPVWAARSVAAGA